MGGNVPSLQAPSVASVKSWSLSQRMARRRDKKRHRMEYHQNTGFPEQLTSKSHMTRKQGKWPEI